MSVMSVNGSTCNTLSKENHMEYLHKVISVFTLILSDISKDSEEILWLLFNTPSPEKHLEYLYKVLSVFFQHNAI